MSSGEVVLVLNARRILLVGIFYRPGCTRELSLGDSSPSHMLPTAFSSFPRGTKKSFHINQCLTLFPQLENHRVTNEKQESDGVMHTSLLILYSNTGASWVRNPSSHNLYPKAPPKDPDPHATTSLASCSCVSEC